MRHKLFEVAFGDKSLLRQAYVQFFLAFIGAFITAQLPQRTQVIVITLISWWAIAITAQGFISAASSNKKLTEALVHFEELLKKAQTIEEKVDDVKADQLNVDQVNTNKITTDEVQEV